MTPTYEGCTAKLDWAETQIATLDEEVTSRYGIGQPNSIRREIEDEGRTHRFFALPTTDDQLREWGVRTGEVIHDLASSLDHLVYGLVRSNGKEPTHRTAFPYFDTSQGFDHSGLDKLNGVTKNVRDRIEAFQPYKRPAGKPQRDELWVLYQLWLIDKHRSLNLVVRRVENVSYFVPDTLISESVGILRTAETPIYEARFSEPCTPDEFQPLITLGIAFEDGIIKTEPLGWWIGARIVPRVREVVATMGPFLTL